MVAVPTDDPFVAAGALDGGATFYFTLAEQTVLVHLDPCSRFG